MDINIITRERWSARLPSSWPSALLELPVDEVILCFTRTAACHDISRCSVQLRKLQKYHMFYKKALDIQYNFMVGCDGNVYEGRGWRHATTTRERPDATQNVSAILVALIGTFEDRSPPDILFEVLEAFISLGISSNFISEDYTRLYMK